MAFGFEEKLMPVLVGKLDDLVLDRRAITRPDTFDLSRIKRRLVQIIADRLMQSVARISDKALDLRLLDLFGRERKCNRLFVRRLRLKCIPVDRSAIKPRRRSGLQTSDRKPMILKGFRQFDRCRFACPTCRECLSCRYGSCRSETFPLR